MRRAQTAFLLGTVAMMTWAAPIRGEDFYEGRLRAGIDSYRAKKPSDAIIDFRIASFGLLERPKLLSESLARMAVAQVAAMKNADASTTMVRFLEVERKFGVFRQYTLEPDVLKMLDQLLTAKVRADLVSAIPSLASRKVAGGLPGGASRLETMEGRPAISSAQATVPSNRSAGTGPQVAPPVDAPKAVEVLSPGQLKLLEAKAAAEPGNVRWPLELARAAAQRRDHLAAIRWSGRALESDIENKAARAIRAHARVAIGARDDVVGDFDQLPPEVIAQNPELYADRFVVLIAKGRWEEAERSVGKLPVEYASRPDVVSALEQLRASRALPANLPAFPASDPNGNRF